jgi:hypothetical protein
MASALAECLAGDGFIMEDSPKQLRGWLKITHAIVPLTTTMTN